LADIIPLRFGVSQAYLICDQNNILLDTGSDTDKAAYQKAFEKAKVNPRDISLVVISHGHSDHFAGLGAIKELTGAPVLCHRLAAQALATGKNPKFVPRNKLGEDMLKLIEGTVPVMDKTVDADILVDKEFDLNAFGVAGKVLHTPGHSHCSLSLLLDGGYVFVGDMVVPSPFDGKLGLAFLATNESELYDSLRTLLSFNQIFYGGHGGPYTRDEVQRLLELDLTKGNLGEEE